MSIESAKEFFRQRIATEGFSNWSDVLESFKRNNPKDGCFYMLTTNKGTGNEMRSRFLTHAEALQTIMYEIEKSKIKK